MINSAVQVQLESVEVQLKEAVAGRAAAQESVEFMREGAENADAKLSELQNELHSSAATAAEQVRFAYTLHLTAQGSLSTFTICQH